LFGCIYKYTTWFVGMNAHVYTALCYLFIGVYMFISCQFIPKNEHVYMVLLYLLIGVFMWFYIL